MDAITEIRNGLIGKVLSISNEEYLKALDQIISSSNTTEKQAMLTDEQKQMLEMSAEDIKYDRTANHEEFKSTVAEWVNNRY